MPVYHFRCDKYGHTFKRLLTVEQYDELDKGTSFFFCQVEGCGYTAKRVQGAATTQAMEVIDDGIRPRKLERLSEAQRVFAEREVAHKLKHGVDEDPTE